MAKSEAKIEILFISLLLPGQMSQSHTGNIIPSAAYYFAVISQQRADILLIPHQMISIPDSPRQCHVRDQYSKDDQALQGK
jgi:hypothetical protein